MVSFVPIVNVKSTVRLGGVEGFRVLGVGVYTQHQLRVVASQVFYLYIYL
jgi:hypothetical protein